MHFNDLIKIKHLETFRSICTSDSDPPGDILNACFSDAAHGICTCALGTATEDGGVDGQTGGRGLGGGAGRPTCCRHHSPLPTNTGTRPAWRSRGHPGPSSPI